MKAKRRQFRLYLSRALRALKRNETAVAKVQMVRAMDDLVELVDTEKELIDIIVVEPFKALRAPRMRINVEDTLQRAIALGKDEPTRAYCLTAVALMLCIGMHHCQDTDLLRGTYPLARFHLLMKKSSRDRRGAHRDAVVGYIHISGCGSCAYPVELLSRNEDTCTVRPLGRVPIGDDKWLEAGKVAKVAAVAVGIEPSAGYTRLDPKINPSGSRRWPFGGQPWR